MHSKQLLLLAALAGASTAAWILEDDFHADNFFDGFDFFSDEDPTNGFVQYLDRSTAQDEALISTDGGSVYMGVDYKNIASDPGRKSVRIETKKTYDHGLILADIAHMPGGICGTWPAFWSTGPNWPGDGELDIIEGINSQDYNIIALHTLDGCTVERSSDFSAELVTTNCFISAPGQGDNQGCMFRDNDPATYGAGFNEAGGGVYATEWTDDAVSIWFFPRGQIPPDVNSSNPDPSSWGTPNARYSGSCDFQKHLKDQRFIINTDLCGDWTNSQWHLDPVCSTKAPTCDQYVKNNPEHFKNAFWEINYMKVFQDGVLPSSSTSAVQPTTTASPTQEQIEDDVPSPAPSDEKTNDNGHQTPTEPAPSDGPSSPTHACTPKPPPSCSTFVTYTTETIVRPAPTDDGEAIVPIPTDLRRHARPRQH